jgi:hypothetical protein
MRIASILAATLVLIVVGTWLVSNSRAATEQPAYTVVRTDGPFEIRDYPELAAASTSMESGEMNGSFGRLFRYITGANSNREEIAMTSPVLIEPGTNGRRMSFILPKATVARGVPAPSATDVATRRIAARRVAVLRFNGGRSAENEAKAIASLKARLATARLTSIGQPFFAYYDPPWTPLPFRRNEVMVRLAPPPQG